MYPFRQETSTENHPEGQNEFAISLVATGFVNQNSIKVSFARVCPIQQSTIIRYVISIIAQYQSSIRHLESCACLINLLRTRLAVKDTDKIKLHPK